MAVPQGGIEQRSLAPIAEDIGRFVLAGLRSFGERRTGKK